MYKTYTVGFKVTARRYKVAQLNGQGTKIMFFWYFLNKLFSHICKVWGLAKLTILQITYNADIDGNDESEWSFQEK